MAEIGSTKGCSEKFTFGTYEEFIYKRTYARWVDSLGRREYFDETVDRYRDFYLSKIPDCAKDDFLSATEDIRKFEVMPSMRAFFAAGPALERDHIAGYNCAGLNIDTLKSFSDLLYILMNGAGVGFSVERQVICKLPPVPDTITSSDDILVFKDSKTVPSGHHKFWNHVIDLKDVISVSNGDADCLVVTSEIDFEKLQMRLGQVVSFGSEFGQTFIGCWIGEYTK